MSDSLEDAILMKLNAYGDSLLDEAPTKKVSNKKGKKRSREEEAEPSKAKKKKKNKSKQDNDIPDNESNNTHKLKGKVRHLEELKSQLALNEFKAKPCDVHGDNEPEFNGKKQNPGMQNGRRQPEVIVFEDPAKRKERRLAGGIKANPKKTAGTSPDNADSEDNVFDLKHARHDVKRLGISGLDQKSKDEAQIQLAMSLGAKAPKNAYVNYRELQEKKKKEQEELASREKDEVVKSKTKSLTESLKTNKTKPKKKELSGVDGQLGSYKNGVLTISKEDKRRINKSR